MWCVKCNHDVAFCTCPDIEDRLRSLNQPGIHVYIAWCENCDKPKSRCTCEVPKA